MVELLLEIDKVQIKYNLNDSQFAKSLGVDPALVSRLKRGLTVPGADFLGCLARVYPELDIIVIQYLKGRGQSNVKSD